MDLDSDPADELIAMFSKISTMDHDALCVQFSRILNVDLGVARFFLEASSWSAERAVHAYLASVDTSAGGLARPNTVPSVNFVGDLRPLDAVLAPGQVVRMVWVFRNDGVEPWPPGTRIVFVDGSRMDGFVYANVAANPGEQVAVVQELRAPAERGVYTATWRLVCSAGYFGDPLWVFLTVGDVVGDALAETFSHSLDMSGQQQQQQARWPPPEQPPSNRGGQWPRGAGDREDFMEL